MFLLDKCLADWNEFCRIRKEKVMNLGDYQDLISHSNIFHNVFIFKLSPKKRKSIQGYKSHPENTSLQKYAE